MAGDRRALCPGYGIDTQVIGWSATKSVTNALIGIWRRDKLSLEGDRRHSLRSPPPSPSTTCCAW
jgi:hypothetical protein